MVAVVVLGVVLLTPSAKQDEKKKDDSAVSLDAEGNWASTSTAKPYIMRDDPPGTGYGRAGLYSYAHNAKGQRFALEPGEIRGVFQTSRGTIISITLGLHLRSRGRPYSFIDIADLTDRDALHGWSYKTSDRGSYTVSRRSGHPLTINLTGGSSGTKIEIVADGETMRVTLDDLYRWRKMKVQDWRLDQLDLGSEKYALLGTVVETDNGLFGGGNGFFKVSELIEDNERLEPNYAVLYDTRTAGVTERVADRVPIGDSGYESVWDSETESYVIRGFGNTVTPSDESWAVDQVYASWKSGVVKVESEGTGTGFIVSVSRGLVLTNDHVAVQDNVQVTFADGSQTRGKVIARDPSSDLALIRVEQQPSSGREILFAQSAATVGQEVILIGHPAGLDWTLSVARIAAFRSEAGKRWLQLDGAINPGNSGGPVFDKQGSVVGVVFARAERSSGQRVILNIGMAVPANIAREFVEKLR
ncbi:MAG: S1C family serine protease [Bacteroidota bacterium]